MFSYSSNKTAFVSYQMLFGNGIPRPNVTLGCVLRPRLYIARH